MATITLNVPDEIKRRMKTFDEVNWSAFVRKQIERKTAEIKNLERIKRQLDKEKDIEEFAVKVQRAHRSGRLQALREKDLL